MLQKIKELKSKILFIDKVRKSEIDIKNETKARLVEILDETDNIIMKNDSFDYLLNMPLWSINAESFAKALDEVKKVAEEYNKYQSTKISTIWKNEYNELCTKLP